MDSTLALGLNERDLFFKVIVTTTNNEMGSFEFPLRYTVDKLKSSIFEKMEELKGLKAKDFLLSLEGNEKLEVEFLKFIRSSPKIEEFVANEEAVPLFLTPKATAGTGSFLGLNTRRPTQLVPPSPHSPMGTKSYAGGMKSAFIDSPSPSSSPTPAHRATTAVLPHSASLSHSASVSGEKSVIRSSVEVSKLKKESHKKQKSKGDIHLSELSNVLNARENEKETTSSPSSPVARPATPLNKDDKLSVSMGSLPRARAESGGGSPTAERPSNRPPPKEKEGRMSKFFSSRFSSDKKKDSTLRVDPVSIPIVDLGGSEPEPSVFADEGGNAAVEEEEGEVNLTEVKSVKIQNQNITTLRARRPTVSQKINMQNLKDQLANVVLTPGLDTFMIETPAPTNDIEEDIFIENEDKNEPYYRINFLGQEHINLCGLHDTIGPVIISAKKYEDGRTILALERTKKGDSRHKFVLPKKSKKNLTAKQLIQLLYPEEYSNFKDIRLIKDPNCTKELETYERRQLISSYKFGLLYVAPGQEKEEDMFYNCNCSPGWTEFLEFLGETVPLKGWSKYRAGLDVKTDTTGTQSVYSVFNKFEVMYHVAPMLPFYPNDPQQLERKRHLGNDIVVIIYIDGNTPFVVDNTIKSEFNHVYCIVQKLPLDSVKTTYKVTFAKKDGVPMYGPTIPKEQLFEKNEDFRNWLMVKLINSERSSYMAPGFRIAIERTKTQLLNELVNGFDKK